MSEDYLIRNCAPTLAGLKTGSLFMCPYESEDTLKDSIRTMNKRLGSKGLRLLPLRRGNGKALIYVYRPRQLSADLSDQLAEKLLLRHGYRIGSCESCILQLARKLRTEKDFPHEIGLFLGYPPEDVDGFIENNSCNCKCVGCWKVYGDADSARKRFAQYKKCSRIYREQWEKGKALERLTVAG